MNDFARFPAAYRSLLWAYPRWYRRERGAEILTVLLEAVPPDQRRPGIREVLDLTLGGLRRRFEVPRGRAGRTAAVLTAAFVAVVVSGSAGWLTWRALPTVPSERQAIAAVTTAVPLPAGRGVRSGDDGNPFQLLFSGALGDLGSAVLPAGADPTTVGIVFSYPTAPGNVAPLVDQVGQRLTAAGWRLADRQGGATTETKDGIVGGSGYFGSFWAAKDDLVLYVVGILTPCGVPVCGGDLTRIEVTVHHQTPTTVSVTASIGLLFGALAGWLMASPVLRAYRRHRPWGRILMLASGLPGLLAAGLLTLIAIFLGAIFSADWNTQSSLVPAAALTAAPPLTIVALVGLVSCALTAAVAPAAERTALPAPGPTDDLLLQ